MAHPIREQRIRQRLNRFRKAQELGSVTDASCGTSSARGSEDGPGQAGSAAPHHARLPGGGVRHRCIRPRSPHLNGKVERSHRIDTEEFYRGRRFRTFSELVRARRRFNAFHNTARLLGTHGGLTPLERLRAFPPYRGLRRLYL